MNKRIQSNQQQNSQTCPVKKKKAPMVEEPNKERYELEKSLRSLEFLARFSASPGEKKEALHTIFAISESFQSAKKEKERSMHNSDNGDGNQNDSRSKEIIRLEECMDSCRFAIERIAMFSDDEETRKQAFESIKKNSIALNFCSKLALFPDIREMARSQMPKKPDRYYSTIGTKHTSDKFRPIVIRMLVHLKGDSLTPDEKESKLKEAEYFEETERIDLGPIKKVLDDLVALINNSRKEENESPIQKNTLIKMLEGFLAHRRGRQIEELVRHFQKIRETRIEERKTEMDCAEDED